MIEYPEFERDGIPSEAMISWCFDNDFWTRFLLAIKQLGYANRKFTPLVRGGVDRRLAEQPEAREEVNLGYDIHGFKKLIVLGHINCKKVGIADPRKEIKRHFEYEDIIRSLVGKDLPADLEIEYHLLGWAGEIPRPQ